MIHAETMDLNQKITKSKPKTQPCCKRKIYSFPFPTTFSLLFIASKFLKHNPPAEHYNFCKARNSSKIARWVPITSRTSYLMGANHELGYSTYHSWVVQVQTRSLFQNSLLYLKTHNPFCKTRFAMQ